MGRNNSPRGMLLISTGGVAFSSFPGTAACVQTVFARERAVGWNNGFCDFGIGDFSMATGFKRAVATELAGELGGN